jgi:hypothetical protein
MTPSQKLIDEAAEAVWEADRALVLPKSRDQMPPWPDAPEDIRESYRARVTIPVTVALKAVVEVAERPEEQGSVRAQRIANAISSLIPQETQNAE